MNQIIDNKLYELIVGAIQSQLTHIDLPKGIRQDKVRTVIRVFMRKHPEIFWFSNQYRFDDSFSTLYLKYNFTPQKKDFYSGQIDNAVRFLFQPERLSCLSDLEKVTYVYEWIASNTTYNEYSSFNQTIFSVLINRNSVCTGYAKTAQYLLGLIGIESELVFGKFHVDDWDDGRHCWNIVKIDDEWYHVDFCMADTRLGYLLNSDESAVEHNGLLWNYFCKSTDYILKNRVIELLEQLPICNKTVDILPRVQLAKPLNKMCVCKSDSGSFSKIYLNSFDKNCVIKSTKVNTSLVDNEFSMLNNLCDCPGIVSLKTRIDEGIVLEQLTPWTELLESHYYEISEFQLASIICQLTTGLIECRDRGITYSDIHPNNVLVSKDGKYKWGDFGLAYTATIDGTIPAQLIGHDNIPLGSRWFMSPETFHKHIFSESSAIYSLAMVAYFVMNNMKPPFKESDNSEQEALSVRLSGEIITPPANSRNFSTLGKIICEILNADENDRIHIFEQFIRLIASHIPVNVGIYLDDMYYNEDSFASFEETPQTVGDDCDGSHIASDGVDNFFFETNSDRCVLASIAITNNSTPDGFTDADEFAYTMGRICRSVCLSNFDFSSSGCSTCDSLLCDDKEISKPSYAPTRQPETRNDALSDISSCVYAPAEVRYNKSFIIRVYMYLPQEQDAVDSKVKEIDPSAVKKEYKPLDLPVKEGDKLTVQLDLSDGVQCKSTTKSVIWRNHFTDCSFTAKLVDPSQDSIEGTAYVFVNDVPAGEMLFTIDVVESQPRELYTNVESHRFSKIFISYAHQDEIQVRGIAEGCRMLGKDYFFDRHTLQAGDLFKEKILSYIDRADLFVLCWSKNAAESDWVKIEREHALQLIREGKTTLSIYPLSLRPEAPLPIDMSDKYNFGKL